MGSLQIYLPANAMHANLLPDSWEFADQEKLGLEVIGKSGIPFSVSYQGICAKLWPWLPDEVKKYDNIELLSSGFGHVLTNHIPEDMWSWEIEKGIIGTVPIRFFSEFSHPKGPFPEEFFFVTQGHYSLHSQIREDYLKGENNYPSAIRYNDKIAILMKEPLFGKFMESFKRFQASPLDEILVQAMVKEIRAIRDLPETDIVICPLDPEAPYTGSDFGAIAVWQEFFKAIRANGLESIFTKIEPWLDCFRDKAVEMNLPLKDLSKWQSYREQINWVNSIQRYLCIDTECQRIKTSLGLCSDILAVSWFRKNPNARIVKAVNRDGEEIEIRITFNSEVQNVVKQAAFSIRGGRRFDDVFAGEKSLFVRRFRNVFKELEN